MVRFSVISFAAAVLLLRLFCVPVFAAAEEIKPPFGLMWGEAATRLERLLTGAKAKIIERRKLPDGRDAWHVEGLVQQGLKRTVFYFRNAQLVEVELQYQKEDWDQTRYDEYMGQVRSVLDRRY